MKQERPLLNLANGLTLSRFVAAPFMLALILGLHAPNTPTHRPWVALACILLLLVTLLTDALDGMAARRMKNVTNFGKIMDPVADSTFFMTVFFALSACPRFQLPIWMPLLILYREVAMHVLRRYAALRGIVLAAKASGKIKMATQSLIICAFFALLAANDQGWYAIKESLWPTLLYGSGLIVVVINLLSLIEYSRDVPDLIREYRETGEPAQASPSGEEDVDS